MSSVLRIALTVAVLAVLGSSQALAAGSCNNGYCWVDGLTPTTIAVNSTRTMFGVTPRPTGTCSYHGYLFSFDNKTETGKALLNMLTAAKLANKQLILWYAQSKVTGDCKTNPDAMAVVTGVGMR